MMLQQSLFFKALADCLPQLQQLPRAVKSCPKCHENEAVYFQSQQRAADTGMVGIRDLPSFCPPHTDDFRNFTMSVQLATMSTRRCERERGCGFWIINQRSEGCANCCIWEESWFRMHRMEDSMHGLELSFIRLATDYRAEVSLHGLGD
jgi:hypothetical protein